MTDHQKPHRRSLLGGLAFAAAAPALAQAATPPPGPWTSQGDVMRPAGRLRWYSVGEGRPLILLHKLGGWSADWNGVAPLLSPGRRLIVFDLPGHGESVMNGPPPYAVSVVESAAMIKAALEDMGIHEFDLAGNSLGGCTALLMSVIWPKAVGKLVLISVSLADGSTRETMMKQDEERRAEFGPNWEPLPRDPSKPSRFDSMGPAIEAEQALSRAKAGVWVRPSERGAGLADIGGFLTRLATPTLMILADKGPYLKYEAVGKARIPHLTVVHVADAASFVHQDKPVETARIVRGFLGG